MTQDGEDATRHSHSPSVSGSNRKDLVAETVRPSALTPADMQTWRGLCQSHSQFSHPLLGPEFAQEVGKVRSDARVTIWRRSGRAVGFLAYHSRPMGPCRPIGSPFSDYHALVSDGSFSVGEALTLANITAYRFDALVDPYGLFAEARVGQRNACAIEHDRPPKLLLEGLIQDHPKLIKNYRRLDRKLERDVGALRLVAPDRSPEAFASLLRWKQSQFARTGVHDVLTAGWVRALLTSLFENSEGDTGGLMICLYAGEQLVAGHFGMRANDTYMPWITSVNPDFKAWSPGHLLLLRSIEMLPPLNLNRYDLGATDATYKEIYARPSFPIYEGLALADSLSGHSVDLAESLWVRFFGQSVSLRRLRRRLRVIAASEPTFGGWMRGCASSLRSYSRRLNS